MGEVVYLSRARIEPMRGPIHYAYFGDIAEPVAFGMQGSLRDWYRVGPEGPETASTLDDIVAAVGG